ncbi:MAG: PAS domain S-box protein [Candidatus Hodarchaeota archaeon]
MLSNNRGTQDIDGEEEYQRFRAFFENAPLYCYIVSPKGIILDVNKTALKVLGYNRVELIGKHIRMIYAPEYEDRVREVFQAWKTHGTVINEELLILSKTGEKRTVLLNASAVTDAAGNLLHSISIQQDITELKEIETALKGSKAAFQQAVEEKTIILDSISEHVVYQDLNNQIIWANKVAAESIDKTVEEITGNFCYALWGQRDTPCVGCPVVKARETNEIQENEITTPDGRVWTVRGYPLKDEEGVLTGIVEVTYEITAQKRAEEAYHQLVDQSIQGLFILQKGKVVFTNPAFVELSGYSEEEILDWKPWQVFDFIHHEDRYRPLEQLRALVEGESGSSSIEIRGIQKNGNIRWFELSLAVIEYQGQLVTQATLMDIHDRKIAEDAIRRERDRAQQYLDIAEILFLAVNAGGIITLVNKKTLEVFGYSEEEMIGQNYFDLCIPERIRNRMKQNYEAVLKGEIKQKPFVENPILTKSGAERLISWHTAILYNEEEKRIGFLTAGNDITEYKTAEEALKASEEKFRSILENTADWVWEIDSEGRITYSNNSVEDIMGITAGQVIGRTLWEYMNPEEVEQSKQFLRERTAQRRPFKNLVNRFFHRDGGTVILEANGRPILDQQNQVIGFRGVCRDITQRMHADKVLRESESRYRALVETSPDAITVTDPEGNIVLVNDRAVNLFGYSVHKELLGQNYFDYVILEQRKEAIENLRYTVELGAASPRQFTLLHKDNTTFPAEISASLLADVKGNPLGYILVTRNISKRKEAERELHEAKARAEFFTDLMAHDLNNINQAILSALELPLLHQAFPQELRAQIQVALDQVERSSALIGRVKKFSQIGASKPLLEVRDLEPDFRSAYKSVKQAFPNKTIRINTNIHPDEFQVLADELLIDLFYNLLHNAVKFDKSEKVELEVKVRNDANKRFLRIEVIDNGPGIPEALKELIFARYTHRIDERTQGSGIGLTLVQQIVARYGGKIWVENRVKEDYTKGAKFVFLLPLWA